MCSIPKVRRWVIAVLVFVPHSLCLAGEHGGEGGGHIPGHEMFHGGHPGPYPMIPFPVGIGGIPGWGAVPSFFMPGPMCCPIMGPGMTIGSGMVFDPGMAFDPGPAGGPMPPVPLGARARPVSRTLPRPADPAKSAQMATIGDRLFRAGNIKRAAERYEQAIRLAPDSALPRIHLAQVSLVRGQVAEAASQIRSAVNADPSWILRAPDIQGLYGEPEDFAKQIAKLESRVLVEPGDRDAWMVLGAQLYLSGRTRRAADVFARLNDRKADAALATFLEAALPASRPAN